MLINHYADIYLSFFFSFPFGLFKRMLIFFLWNLPLKSIIIKNMDQVEKNVVMLLLITQSQISTEADLIFMSLV